MEGEERIEGGGRDNAIGQRGKGKGKNTNKVRKSGKRERKRRCLWEIRMESEREVRKMMQS